MTDQLSARILTHPASVTGFQRDRVRLSLMGDYGVSLPALNPADYNSVVNVIYQVCIAYLLAVRQYLPLIVHPLAGK